ncbi:uncharacterized protein LOC6640131 [Drosophila willistoni]|uniref:uncharacterized protein LOC6640131 n=1 Tax=Drosophila willistoni TaxID=7260 RepID=UPI000C26CB9F|nr:uncharacterized protein LOC6640131 [Drosophila willistoni]
MHLILGALLVLTFCLKSSDSIIPFTKASTHGIFVALAVPIQLPHRNCFVSYNFEANYNSPDSWGIFTIFQNGPIESDESLEVESSRKILNGYGNQTQEDVEEENGAEEEDDDAEVETTTAIPTQTSVVKRKSRSLLTRSNIYHILKDKFERSGFPGEPCLLRLICEVSLSELGEFNGVVGSLMHVIFSPSTSEPEDLPLKYYQAEHDGWHDNCHYYKGNCRESLLDLISEPFEMILKSIEQNEM